MTATGAAQKQAIRVRAYPLPTFANEGKLARVHALLDPWRDALVGMQASCTGKSSTASPS